MLFQLAWWPNRVNDGNEKHWHCPAVAAARTAETAPLPLSISLALDGIDATEVRAGEVAHCGP